MRPTTVLRRTLPGRMSLLLTPVRTRVGLRAHGSDVRAEQDAA